MGSVNKTSVRIFSLAIEDECGKKAAVKYALRMMSRCIQWGVLGLVVGLVTGCCPHRFSKPAAVIDDPAVLLERLSARADQTTSFEYNTRVSHYGDAGVFKGSVDVLGAAEAKLRFEVLSPTDDTLAVLASDGKRFMSHQRGQTRCEVGDACAANVSRFLPVVLSGADLVRLMTGSAPRMTFESSKLTWDECEGTYRLTLIRNDDRMRTDLWVAPKDYFVVRMRVTRDGKERLLVENEDFRTVNGVVIPHSIQVKVADTNTDLLISLREAWLNQLQEGPHFLTTCPVGSQPQEVSCP